MKATFDNLPALTAALIERVAVLEVLVKELINCMSAIPAAEVKENDLFTVEKLCEKYDVSKGTVYKWFHSGLKVTKMGRKTFVKLKDLQAFEQKQNQLTNLKKS